MQVYIGIDWSATKHDVVWMNDAGGVITSAVIQHNVSGFQKFEKHRPAITNEIERADCLVGLETSHNLLIDYLWAQGYSQIYVVPPKVVKGSRNRYKSSGAYTHGMMPVCWLIFCVRIGQRCSPGVQTVY